jgi:hypothetical protein
MPQIIGRECSVCHHQIPLEAEQSLCPICSGQLVLHSEAGRKPADELRGRLPTSLPVGGIITPQ